MMIEKKLTALLCILLFIAFPFRSLAEESYTCEDCIFSGYVTTDLNIRSGPDTNFDIIGFFPSGTEVDIIGKCKETGWYKIDGGEEKWVCGLYVSNYEPVVAMSEGDPYEIIQADGFVPEERLRNANEKLNLAPLSLREAFVNSDWEYYLSEYDVDDTYAGGAYGSLQGMTIYDYHVIYLDNRDIAVEEATLHEFGHFVDYYYGIISSDAEFVEAYYAETDIFCQTFNYHNGEYNYNELFGEAFDKYIEQPDVLANTCPQIYAFMEEYIPDE